LLDRAGLNGPQGPRNRSSSKPLKLAGQSDGRSRISCTASGLEAVEEHLQIKTLLRAIDHLSEGNERFDAKLKVLIDDVEHHVEEEEGELFPKVKRQLSDEQLEELGLELEAVKKDFGRKPRARAASSR
jgi:hypothetical protein